MSKCFVPILRLCFVLADLLLNISLGFLGTLFEFRNVVFGVERGRLFVLGDMVWTKDLSHELVIQSESGNSQVSMREAVNLFIAIVGLDERRSVEAFESLLSLRVYGLLLVLLSLCLSLLLLLLRLHLGESLLTLLLLLLLLGLHLSLKLCVLLLLSLLCVECLCVCSVLLLLLLLLLLHGHNDLLLCHLLWTHLLLLGHSVWGCTCSSLGHHLLVQC